VFIFKPRSIGSWVGCTVLGAWTLLKWRVMELVLGTEWRLSKKMKDPPSPEAERLLL
jgi:hypothetical protein